MTFIRQSFLYFFRLTLNTFAIIYYKKYRYFFPLLCMCISVLGGCIILPSDTLIKARKAKEQYEFLLMESTPEIVMGKRGHFSITCGKMLNTSKCYGSYKREDSLFIIKYINKDCMCINSRVFLYSDSIFYELDSNSVKRNAWYVSKKKSVIEQE